MSDLRIHVWHLSLPLLQLKYHYQIQPMHLKAAKREFGFSNLFSLK